MNPNTETPLLYTLRRSERAKNTRIVVKPGKIEVVAPPKVSERHIKDFVDAQQDWIRSAIKRVADKVQAVPTLAPTHYGDGATIPFQGKHIPLQIKPTRLGFCSAKPKARLADATASPAVTECRKCRRSIDPLLRQSIAQEFGLRYAYSRV